MYVCLCIYIYILFRIFFRREKINMTNIGKKIIIAMAAKSEWTKMEENESVSFTGVFTSLVL
jgi:hypothetical protein